MRALECHNVRHLKLERAYTTLVAKRIKGQILGFASIVDKEIQKQTKQVTNQATSCGS